MGLEGVPPARPAPRPHPREGLSRAISFLWKWEGSATSAGSMGLPACPPCPGDDPLARAVVPPSLPTGYF